MQNITYEEILPLNDLPIAIRNLLHTSNLPWLNSLEFCTGYVPNPAEHLLLRRDDGQIYDALFYRVITKKIGLRIVEIVGFPTVSDEDIQKLIKTNQAHLAVVNRLEKPVKHNEEWQTVKNNVYCKSYVTIAKLPRCKHEYLNLLSKNDRKQLPIYLQKLNTHFENTVEMRFEHAKDIKFEDVIKLEYLNRERRAKRGGSVNSTREIHQRQQKRWTLTKAFGLLVTFRFQGEIIGGTLNYLYGDKASMIIVAHNPKYDCFRLGKLSIWKTIAFLIDNGVTECNFLWGRKVFKTQFLGVEYPWSIYTVSPHSWLAIVWKKYIVFDEFRKRAWRFLKTKAAFIDF